MNLLSCPSLVTREDEEEKCVCKPIEMVNGAIVECRAHGVCAYACIQHGELYPEPICLTRDRRSLQAQKWSNVNLNSGLEFVSNR